MREWRRERGLSQERLASLLGVNRLTVIRWEKSQRKIPVFMERALRDIERELVEMEGRQS